MRFCFDDGANCYVMHPYYFRYGSDEFGYICDIKNKVFIDKDELGYIYIEDYYKINKKYNSDKTRTVKYRSDKFVWECFNYTLKIGSIGHIDGDKLNDKLSNLKRVIFKF